MKNPTIQFIANQLRPYRRTVARLSIVAVIAAVLETVVPIVYGRALDAVIQQRPLQVLGMLLATWLALRFIIDAFKRQIHYRGQGIAQRSVVAFTCSAMDRLLDLEVSAHYAHRSGEIQESVSRTGNALRQLLRMGVFDLLPNLLTIVIISAYLFTIDMWIGAVNIVIIVVFVGQSISYVARFDAAWNHLEEVTRKFFGRRWDAIRNILVVKSSGAEAYERATSEKLSADVMEANVSSEALFRRHNAEHDATYSIGVVLLFAIAALGIAGGRLTPGQLVTVFGYSFFTWGIIRGAVWVYWDYIDLGVHVRKYAEIARLPTEPYGVGRPLEIRGGVEFQSVRFRYRDDTPVLEDVSFRVEPGQTVALVGESGEGKTTIVELLSRYHQSQSGTITVDGVPTTEIELGSLRSQIAYVPQDLSLFHDSIRENIRYGKLNATDAEVEDAARKAALHDWITTLADGYSTKVGERGLKLSAGQRQRIAIARAFLRNPKILILDEPTSNLDAITEAQIHKSLRDLMAGRTTFIVAHRLRTVQEADRIFVLQDGRIIEQGTHDELMAKSGVYRKLRDMQFSDATREAA